MGLVALRFFGAYCRSCSTSRCLKLRKPSLKPFRSSRLGRAREDFEREDAVVVGVTGGVQRVRGRRPAPRPTSPCGREPSRRTRWSSRRTPSWRSVIAALSLSRCPSRPCAGRMGQAGANLRSEERERHEIESLRIFAARPSRPMSRSRMGRMGHSRSAVRDSCIAPKLKEPLINAVARL
jgi:hypothetical protein